MKTYKRMGALLVMMWACPVVCWAGMPMMVLSDIVSMRLQDVSFFIVLFLLCIWGIRWLWNQLAADFTRLPALSFKQATILMVLLSLMMILVLSMISGARELLTPDAWRKDGISYKLNVELERKERITRLSGPLLAFADQHEGQFPTDPGEVHIPPDAWIADPKSGHQYEYVPGLTKESGRAILLYEPKSKGDFRFVVRVDGQVLKLSSGLIKQELARGTGYGTN